MDILNSLNNEADYSKNQLQLILAAWVMSSALEKTKRISTTNGHIEEAEYEKGSIYSLLYSLYRSMGMARSDTGVPYEFTFNTWGYAWPKGWGDAPTGATDPQRFGKNAYTGLFRQKAVEDYVAERSGKVHVVEMGCGTGAGAHYVCGNVLKDCTYEAFDMQQAAIRTANRKFVPELGGRLKATRANCTALELKDGVADIVAVCETHVTEMPGVITDEDRRFFATAHRLIKPGGFLVWGNAIPDSTWNPCFEHLESIGMKRVEERNVTDSAIEARDLDEGRVDAYVEQCLSSFWGFKIPVLGSRRGTEARLAMKNFYRNPGTNLYDNMKNGTDSYKVVAFQRPA
jgi:ubiquinone/menaquinone biosynthesis C-methylase UbiE